jgi:hypothetical protein
MTDNLPSYDSLRAVEYEALLKAKVVDFGK